MSRIFATYPRRVVRINSKNNRNCRKYTATKSSWARVSRLIQSRSVSTYYRTRTGMYWEYSKEAHSR